MSFKDNIGKPHVAPTATQCEMVEVDYEMIEVRSPESSCTLRFETQCLDPAVGYVPDCQTRVCAICAKVMAAEEWDVTYYDKEDK